MSSFDRLLAWVDREPDVVGVVLSGSRGRGLGRVDSDWDVYLIVDARAEQFEEAVSAFSDGDLDVSVITSTEFPDYAAPGSEREWDAYALVHATIVVDRSNGWLAALADAKETLPADLALTREREALDGCLNALVRSAKSRRDGEHDQAMLDAAEGVAPFLDVMFASEQRIRPYNRYLCWELKRHPLSEATVDCDEMVRLLVRTLQGQHAASGEMFRLLERRARDVGIHDIVTAWDEVSLSLIR